MTKDLLFKDQDNITGVGYRPVGLTMAVHLSAPVHHTLRACRVDSKPVLCIHVLTGNPLVCPAHSASPCHNYVT